MSTTYKSPRCLKRAAATLAQGKPADDSGALLAGEPLWQLAQDATRLRLTAGIQAEVQETAAALQDLACQFAESSGSRDPATATFSRPAVRRVDHIEVPPRDPVAERSHGANHSLVGR
jgi:hypothetical protein